MILIKIKTFNSKKKMKFLEFNDDDFNEENLYEEKNKHDIFNIQ